MNTGLEKNGTLEAYLEEQSVSLFAALAHCTRLRIVKLLTAKGPMAVNELAEALGVQQPGVSQHLAILTRAGVLTVEQRRVSRLYQLRGPRIPAIVALAEEFCQVHGLYPAEALHTPAGITDPSQIR